MLSCRPAERSLASATRAQLRPSYGSLRPQAACCGRWPRALHSSRVLGSGWPRRGERALILVQHRIEVKLRRQSTWEICRCRLEAGRMMSYRYIRSRLRHGACHTTSLAARMAHEGISRPRVYRTVTSQHRGFSVVTKHPQAGLIRNIA